MPSFKVNHHTLKIITLVYKRWESCNECRYFRRSDMAKQFLNRIDEDGPWTNWDLYHLAYETEKSLLVPTFDGLQAPKHLSHFTPLPHQLEVAQNVIEQMNGKAILEMK